MNIIYALRNPDGLWLAQHTKEVFMEGTQTTTDLQKAWLHLGHPKTYMNFEPVAIDKTDEGKWEIRND